MKKSKSMQGMSRNKLIATVSLAVIVITMMASTSTAVLVYSTPTTEDEGWVEGDYEGSLEEQEEQAQEDWEDAGRPGDEDNGDDNDNEDDTENQDGDTNLSRWISITRRSRMSATRTTNLSRWISCAGR
jgi:hypothetical protein